jgi:osmotically-inducible protein OsmY
MKSDMDIRHDVEAELRWEPRVNDATAIGVAVKNGVATISGHVQSYLERSAAERAVERVSGVTAVANELDVHLPSDWERTDEEIAQAAVNAVNWNLAVPAGRIQVEVAKGWVTLKGDVDWQYQRDAANDAIRYLTGVRGVTNVVVLKSPISRTAVKKDIEAALKRRADIDAQKIGVDANGHAVTLTGEVRSSNERKEAERAAWAAPGVYTVDKSNRRQRFLERDPPAVCRRRRIRASDRDGGLGRGIRRIGHLCLGREAVREDAPRASGVYATFTPE